MNQFNETLKNAIQKSFPDESRLSLSEKNQIMDRVRASKGKAPRKRLDVFPKALTAVAAAGFIFAAGGLAAKEFGFLDGGHTDSPNSAAIGGGYDNLKPGEFYKGWELVKMDPNGAASFAGTTALKGTLVYYDEAGGDRLVFIPDPDSAKLLPTSHGGVRNLAFSGDDVKKVTDLFFIRPGDIIENVKIEISAYTSFEGKDATDKISFKQALEIPDPAVTQSNGQVRIGPEGKLALDENLYTIYEKYSQSHDDKLLAGLDPFSIFLLYFYAEERADWETKYYLFNHSPNVYAPFASVEEYVAEMEKGESGLLKMVRESGHVRVDIRSNRTATIYLQEDFGFNMSQDDNGIWKVNWMPIQ